MGKVYGIDLGTTYSVIATLDDNGMPVVIPNVDEGSDLLASAVYFPEDGNPVVGEIAKGQKAAEPDRVVEFVKRYIGKPDAPLYEFNGVKYGSIEISALILKRMKGYANAQGHDVKDVVITCPAYFGMEERAATKQAAIIAGLNVLSIINEPTAAVLSYCAWKVNKNSKILVYDLGGGTFDITLMDFSVDSNGKPNVDFIKTCGNDRLGGIDWDCRMFDYMCQKHAEENGTEISDFDDELKAIIRAQVEQAKCDLSKLEKKGYIIKYAGDRTLINLTRKEFEERTQDLVEQTMDFVRQLLFDTNFTPNDVDMVLLVGGSTFMPMIKNAVETMFPGKVRIEQPNLAFAKGAAICAYFETNGELPKPVTDRLTRSIGPAIFVDENNYMIENLLFVGDEIPAETERIYRTVTDNQQELVITVYENISEDRVNKYVTPCYDANGNEQYTDPALKVKCIGDAHLRLPPNVPRGTPIKVVYRVDTSGLRITATNMNTGESFKADIVSKNNLSFEEIEKVKKEIKWNSEIKTETELEIIVNVHEKKINSATIPEIKVKRLGDVRLPLPTSISKENPFNATFHFGEIGLTVTSGNTEIGKSNV